jgi:hypothetical protein
VHAGVGTGDPAVAGIDEVLRALAERRVEALLYSAGFTAPGFETAIADALLQAAEVVPLEDRPLDPLGGAAAVLRF